MTQEEKLKALEAKKKAREVIHTKMNKDYDRGEGPGFIFNAAEHIEKLIPQFLPTGIDELDEALGGGLPKGAVSCIHGVEFCGKTGIALEAAKTCIEGLGMVLYICTEGSFPHDVAKLIGVDLESGQFDIVIPQGYGEEVINTIEANLIDHVTGKLRQIYDLIIFDSINCLVPKSTLDTFEKDGAEKDGQMARKAKMYTDMLERLLGRGLLRNGTSMLLIAQDRANMDSNSSKFFPTVMSGGKAIKYDSKVIMGLSKKVIRTKMKDGKMEDVGHEIFVNITKNSVTGIPKRSTYAVMYGRGRDDSGALQRKLGDWGYLIKDKAITGKATTIIVPLDNGDWWFNKLSELTERLQQDDEFKSRVKTLIGKGKPKETPESTGLKFDYPSLDVPEVGEEDGN